MLDIKYDIYAVGKYNTLISSYNRLKPIKINRPCKIQRNVFRMENFKQRKNSFKKFNKEVELKEKQRPFISKGTLIDLLV